MSDLDNKSILVTGGSGSFGKKFIKNILENHNPSRVVVYSRDEMKQWHMQQEYVDDKRIRFFVGDVRDERRITTACKGMDYIVHAAALKIVPIAEYNPIECVKTNILGAMNVISAALAQGVKKVVALSTDKASSPINLYGATKLCSDKLFIAANSYGGDSGTRFSVVRYGNVMASRGSVIPFFLSLKESKFLPITHEEMTRFMITLEEGVNLVKIIFNEMQGGEIFVKKSPSMKVVDIAKTISPDCKFNLIGLRPGEKIHEQMIGPENAPFTYEYEDYYIIFPEIKFWQNTPYDLKGGKLVEKNFNYSSNLNSSWLTKDELSNFIKKMQL